MIARSLIAIFLSFVTLTSFGQNEFGNIHVKVIDAETNQPVPFANVYLNQTTIGGFANEQGEVDVKKIPFGTHQLVVSEIGHIPQQRKLIIKATQTMYITVTLRERMLDVVTVVAKHDRKWRRQFKRFEKMFFGSAHFKQCDITNPSALQFNDQNGQFIADSKEPLKIENNYLGYKLDFVITNCFFTAEKFNITGFARFEEKKGDEKQSNKWKEHREKIYRGSPQHFFPYGDRQCIAN
ncbi:MAG: carboxypeptidase-like regulatory domain-containing protein [Bacteroidota bacterium]